MLAREHADFPARRRQWLILRSCNIFSTVFGGRKIPASQLEQLSKWLDGEPEVPVGLWYKRFSGMTVYGEGELIKTFLLPGQAPKGQRLP